MESTNYTIHLYRGEWERGPTFQRCSLEFVRECFQGEITASPFLVKDVLGSGEMITRYPPTQAYIFDDTNQVVVDQWSTDDILKIR